MWAAARLALRRPRPLSSVSRAPPPHTHLEAAARGGFERCESIDVLLASLLRLFCVLFLKEGRPLGRRRRRRARRRVPHRLLQLPRQRRVNTRSPKSSGCMIVNTSASTPSASIVAQSASAEPRSPTNWRTRSRTVGGSADLRLLDELRVLVHRSLIGPLLRVLIFLEGGSTGVGVSCFEFSGARARRPASSSCWRLLAALATNRASRVDRPAKPPALPFLTCARRPSTPCGASRGLSCASLAPSWHHHTPSSGPCGSASPRRRAVRPHLTDPAFAGRSAGPAKAPRQPGRGDFSSAMRSTSSRRRATSSDSSLSSRCAASNASARNNSTALETCTLMALST